MENEPLHILLADDDQDDRLLFTEAFAEMKIKTVVETVNNGVELMKRLKNEKLILPQLLFLDLNMPRKNGIQCLKEIKNSGRFQEISVAIYSTSNSEKDIDEALAHGANIYITKPTDFDVLQIVLEKAVMAAFQYQEDGMKKENFLLKI